MRNRKSTLERLERVEAILDELLGRLERSHDGDADVDRALQEWKSTMPADGELLDLVDSATAATRIELRRRIARLALLGASVESARRDGV